MRKYSKYARLVAKILIFVLVVTTVLFGIPPETARAAGLFNNLPDSKPGGDFTVKWYSAKRYYPGMGPEAGAYVERLLSINPPVDKIDSDAALQRYDTSVFLKKEIKSELTFNMDMWQPDKEYWYDYKSQNNWNWCELEGFVKIPDIPIPKGYREDNFYLASVGADSSQRSDISYDLEIPNNGALHPGTIVPFLLRIKCYEPDQSRLNTQFSIVFNYRARLLGQVTWDDLLMKDMGNIPPQNIYSTIALKDMKPFFELDPQKYMLTLNMNDRVFRDEGYEYGYAGGADFKPLSRGKNYLELGSGDVIVRYKIIPTWYITVGTIGPPAEGTLFVARRTPDSASLVWSAPPGDPIGYDIYRQEVGTLQGFSLPGVISTVSANPPALNVGATSDLAFIDQGLRHDVVYAYYIVAHYQGGGHSITNTVRTDSAVMEGLPSTPGNLKAELADQTSRSDLKLSWDPSGSQAGIKEYIVYRRVTDFPSAPAKVSSDGWTYIPLNLIMPPAEIARTTVPRFLDRGLNYNTKYEYYLQAVDKNNVTSYISSPIEVVVKDVTAPAAPGNFKIGNVLRQGEDAQYDFTSRSGNQNALLGPRREVALSWDSSKDNVGVTGYNIYRKAFGKDLKDYEYWEESVKLIGSTKENIFVDSGLKFGAYYIYYVEATDEAGNGALSEAHINTMKSTLSDLSIKSGSKPLTPSPAFAYYNSDYTLDVANEVSTIRLIPQKTDSLSEVRINGIGVDGGIDLKLDPGENVIPIEVRQSSVTQETMNYTLTVNRANLEDLPELKLTDPGMAIKEGDIYKASGIIGLQASRDWTGSVDYGDGTEIQPLKTDKDGAFVLQHQYMDNGRYKIDVVFRYLDKGMVKASLETTVNNVAPIMTGIKDEYTVREGDLLKIDGIVVDPGRDTWFVTGYADGLGPQITTVVMADKSFSLGATVFDKQPLYDMRLQVTDDDGGAWSKIVKLKVENVAPVVQAKGVPMVQLGDEFIGSGSFADPGLDQWKATVDYGDGSGRQPLNLKADKTFDLKHVFSRNGNYTVTVHVEDQNQGAGDASLQVKVKDYVSTLELGEDISLEEGDTLSRSIPVRGYSSRISKILVDYGDGSGEKPVALTANKSGTNLLRDETASMESSAWATLIGTLPLQHTYKDNGTYTVKAKIVDTDGDVYEDSFKAEVANVLPTVELNDGVIYAGDSFTCRGTITDPGDDAWTVEISSNYGFEPLKISLGSDKTFSFSRTFSIRGIFDIGATVTDDDGGVGYGACKLTVNRRPSVSASVSNDATIHSLLFPVTLYQDDGIHTDTGFIPECLTYTTNLGSTMTPNFIVYVDDGATVQFTDVATPTLTSVTPGVSVLGNFGLAVPITIVVTAEDGVTTRTYEIYY